MSMLTRSRRWLSSTAKVSHTKVAQQHQPRVYSGIQPTGALTIGNYCGAVKNWVQLQSTSVENGWLSPLYCVVDFHAITVPQDPSTLREGRRLAMSTLLACGIDPKQSILYLQGDVKEHTELAWILGTITPLGWLKRMIQYKEKSKKNSNENLGLLAYPVLQAADIMLFQSTIVPVGEDQRQHIELARDIGQLFNRSFGETFAIPEGMYTSAPRIMSLRDGTKKMSKSDPSDLSRINLTDSADVIAKKIKRAQTDQIPHITNDSDEVVARYEGKNLSQFKTHLTDRVVQVVGPIAVEMEKLKADRQFVDSVIVDGQARAQEIASCTMKQVKESLGLGYR